MIPDTIKVLKFGKYFKQYGYINNCKIEDVIKLFKTLMQLYTYMSENSTTDITVNEVLDYFNIKSGPMILIKSDNRWYDLRKAYLFGLQINIDGLNQALKDGLIFIYELNNCRINGGL